MIISLIMSIVLILGTIVYTVPGVPEWCVSFYYFVQTSGITAIFALEYSKNGRIEFLEKRLEEEAERRMKNLNLFMEEHNDT